MTFAFIKTQDVTRRTRSLDEICFPISVACLQIDHCWPLRNIDSFRDFGAHRFVASTVASVAVDLKVGVQIATSLLVCEDVLVNGAGAHRMAAQGQTPADLLRAMLGLKSYHNLFNNLFVDHR